MLVARDDEVNAGLPGDVLCRDGDSGAVLMAGIWRSYHDSISFFLVNYGNSLGLPYVASLQGITLNQWEFRDPKMVRQYHIRLIFFVLPYFAGIFPEIYIGLKNLPYIW